MNLPKLAEKLEYLSTNSSVDPGTFQYFLGTIISCCDIHNPQDMDFLRLIQPLVLRKES